MVSPNQPPLPPEPSAAMGSYKHRENHTHDPIQALPLPPPPHRLGYSLPDLVRTYEYHSYVEKLSDPAIDTVRWDGFSKWYHHVKPLHVQYQATRDIAPLKAFLSLYRGEELLMDFLFALYADHDLHPKHSLPVCKQNPLGEPRVYDDQADTVGLMADRPSASPQPSTSQRDSFGASLTPGNELQTTRDVPDSPAPSRVHDTMRSPERSAPPLVGEEAAIEPAPPKDKYMKMYEMWVVAERRKEEENLQRLRDRELSKVAAATRTVAPSRIPPIPSNLPAALAAQPAGHQQPLQTFAQPLPTRHDTVT